MVDPIAERATYHFTVKVYPSGQLYMACDPIDGTLAMAGDGVFGFDLRQGITAEQATEIAQFLNNHRICMTYVWPIHFSKAQSAQAGDVRHASTRLPRREEVRP
jgi:hypothetical protein